MKCRETIRAAVLTAVALLGNAVGGQLLEVELEPFEVHGAGRLGDGLELGWSSGGGSAFGVDAARTHLSLSAEALSAGGITDIQQLAQWLPGASAPARFGVVTVPNLRGDAAELFFNGQRRGDNLFGLVPSLAIVGEVSVASGAPLLAAGPGKRTGGALDWRTRPALAGQTEGEVTLRLGSWLPGGGSFFTGEWLVDHNLAIGEDQAVRLIAGVREDDTYFHRNGGHNDGREIYLTYRAGPQLQLIAYYQKLQQPQTLGVNRPWQGLIDDGHYVTGRLVPLAGEAGLIEAGPQDFVRLPRDRVLLSQGDRGDGELVLGQLLWQHEGANGWRWSQALLLEQVRRSKEHAFYYAERVRQVTFDSQTRVAGGAHAGEPGFSWESGIHLRLEQRANLTNYWNELAYAFDISSGRRFAAYEAFPESIAIGAVHDSAGRPWYLPSSIWATPESSDSRLQQAGSFAHLQYRFSQSLAFALGGRLDHFALRASEPAALAEAPLRAEADETLAGGAASLLFQARRISWHATATQMRGIAGNTVGDGINLYPPGNLWPQDFRNHSRLLEVGGSLALQPGAQLSFSLFSQQRTRREFFGNYSIRANGANLALQLQIARPTRLLLRLDYLDARYRDAAPAEFGGGSIWNVYASGSGPTGEGLGLGYLGGFFLNSLPAADYPLAGVSKWQAHAHLQHHFSPSWSILASLDWQSRQAGNLAREWFIPAQLDTALVLTYQRTSWDVRLIARNLLDADNWRHNGDSFFNQMLVSRDLPRRFELVARFRY